MENFSSINTITDSASVITTLANLKTTEGALSAPSDTELSLKEKQQDLIKELEIVSRQIIEYQDSTKYLDNLIKSFKTLYKNYQLSAEDIRLQGNKIILLPKDQAQVIVDTNSERNKDLLLQSHYCYITLPVYSWRGEITIPQQNASTISAVHFDWTVENTTPELLSIEEKGVFLEKLHRTCPNFKRYTSVGNENLLLNLHKRNHPHVSGTGYAGTINTMYDCCFGSENHIIKKAVPSNPSINYYKNVIDAMLMWLREHNYKDTFGNSTLGLCSVHANYMSHNSRNILFKNLMKAFSQLLKDTPFLTLHEAYQNNSYQDNSHQGYVSIAQTLFGEIDTLCQETPEDSGSLHYLLYAALENLQRLENVITAATTTTTTTITSLKITYEYYLAHIIRCGVHLAYHMDITANEILKDITKDITSIPIIQELIGQKNSKQEQYRSTTLYRTDQLIFGPQYKTYESAKVIDLLMLATTTLPTPAPAPFNLDNINPKTNVLRNLEAFGALYTQSFLGIFQCVLG